MLNCPVEFTRHANCERKEKRKIGGGGGGEGLGAAGFLTKCQKKPLNCNSFFLQKQGILFKEV